MSCKSLDNLLAGLNWVFCKCMGFLLARCFTTFLFSNRVFRVSSCKNLSGLLGLSDDPPIRFWFIVIWSDSAVLDV